MSASKEALDQPVQGGSPLEEKGEYPHSGQPKLVCRIGFEEIAADKGLACPRGHFLCDECLGNYFVSRINIKNIQTDLLQLPCPVQ